MESNIIQIPLEMVKNQKIELVPSFFQDTFEFEHNSLFYVGIHDKLSSSGGPGSYYRNSSP